MKSALWSEFGHIHHFLNFKYLICYLKSLVQQHTVPVEMCHQITWKKWFTCHKTFLTYSMLLISIIVRHIGLDMYSSFEYRVSNCLVQVTWMLFSTITLYAMDSILIDKDKNILPICTDISCKISNARYEQSVFGNEKKIKHNLV